ncbi:segregation/condensation protein A [bacterium]|nr:segregation/condensation protein A [bacterium]
MSSFALEHEKFQGPLEVLLNLIESRKMSISEVSLSQVADSYLAYVEKLPELPLAETSQFVLVASTLLLIKSRSLLPTLDMTQEEKESVEELENRLARYAVYRKAAKLLKQQWGTKPLMLAQRAPERPRVFAPGEATTQKLIAAVKKMMRSFPTPEKMVEAVVKPVIALEEVIGTLKKRLTLGFRTRWSELTKTASREDRVVYFLAVLELVRSGSASVSQEKLFSDIVIETENISSAPVYG